MTTSDATVQAMVAAVRAAGRISREIQLALDDSGTFTKEDRSPVTVADLTTQALIAHTLLPDLPLVGEEDSGPLRESATIRAQVMSYLRPVWPDVTEDAVYAAIDRGSAAGGMEPFLTLDPIDGTKGFLRGDQYAVALALVEEGQPVVGILGCPNLEALDGSRGVVLVAVRGQGTRALPLDDDGLDGEDCAVSSRSDPTVARLCESVEAAHTAHSESAALARSLGLRADPVRIDSQAKYAVIAQGVADLYLRLPTDPGRREKIWDHAAGMLVVTEAGGTVTDLDGLPLDFGCGRKLERNRGIAASNGFVHEAVIAAIRDA